MSFGCSSSTPLGAPGPPSEDDLQASFRRRYAPATTEVLVHREVAHPVATVVVVSYRAGDYLLDCLRCLRAQACEAAFEIVLADSGGLEHLRARYGSLVDVELRLAPGLPLNVARNAAMAFARGPLVAYVDDDGLVENDWLAEALRAFDDPLVAAVRGRIAPHEHRYFNTYAVHYDRGDALWDDGSLSTEGNLMIRRGVYLALGGFPDDYYGAEGIHLAWRLHRRFPTLRTVYVPGMVMRHDYCRTLREFIWKCRKYRTTLHDRSGEDPDFCAYVEGFRRSPKPAPRLSPDEAVAKRLLRTAERVIVRLPWLDHITRR